MICTDCVVEARDLVDVHEVMDDDAPYHFSLWYLMGKRRPSHLVIMAVLPCEDLFLLSGVFSDWSAISS